MKRYSNLWEKVISYENIEEAYRKAKKGKSKYTQVQKIERDKEYYLIKLQKSLIDKTFITSDYVIKKIYEPKERDIYILPFYPDRIVQHALMNVVAPIWDKMFYYHSYACRPGKGQHKASLEVRKAIKKYKYYFQGDIKKFYPSINHSILLKIIEKKIKDKQILWLMKNIIKSIKGNTNVPIGNYTSQWFGNLYMNELDTYIKQDLKIKDYIRYNDDFVLFHNCKECLKKIRNKINLFLKNKLDLILSKIKILPTFKGITFVGYRHFKEKVILRKSTKKRINSKLKDNKDLSIIAAIKGWLMWCDCFNLQKRLGVI